ncbi:MAG: DUF6132 family protein [Verrucomicrobiia bacterium]
MIMRIVVGAVIGAVAGFAWQRLAGCSSGACPLMSNAWISTAYGLVAGVLVAMNAR